MSDTETPLSLAMVLIFFGATISFTNGVYALNRSQIEFYMRIRWLGPIVATVGLVAGWIEVLRGSATIGVPNPWISLAALCLYVWSEFARRKRLPVRTIGRRSVDDHRSGGVQWRTSMILGHLAAILAVIVGP